MSREEQLAWEKILEQHGLGMQRGTSHWLQFGASYVDHDTGHTYDTANKRPDKRTAANINRARALLALMASTGLSMKKAAKEMGIPQQTASYIIRRYKSVLSTLPSFQQSSEGQ